jgi:predicted metal-dependent hydrolase
MTATETLSQTPFDLTVRKDIDWNFSDVEAAFVDHPTPLVSYLWAAVSAGATPIESFFIKTLVPTLETISGDPKLQQDVKDMIAQEAQHSASHRKLNDHLKTKGYDIDGLQTYFKEVLAKMTNGLTPKDMLGVVSAGEHGLYSIAHVYLKSKTLREQIHPQVDKLFLYHFLEEAEHGAVSHDQYRYFFGNDYFHRLKTVFRARFVFSMLSEGVEIAARGFGHKITLRDRWLLFYYKWINPGPFRSMVLRVLEYMSPWYKLTFDHEDMEQMKKWNDELYAD